MIIRKLKQENQIREEETISLRFNIQQMLDDAQLCDTKNNLISKGIYINFFSNYFNNLSYFKAENHFISSF